MSLIDLRARCALLEVKNGGDRGLLRFVRRDVRRLQREIGTWVQPFVWRLRAGVHELQDELDQAQAALSQASVAFEQIGFLACAAGAKRRIGQLMTGPTGVQLIAQADESSKISQLSTSMLFIGCCAMRKPPTPALCFAIH